MGKGSRSAPGRRPPLALIFSLTLTGILANTLINAPLPDIIDDFGVDEDWAGVLVAAATFPGIFVAPIIGLLADRFGRRAVLVPCLGVFGLAGIGAALAPTFAVLVVMRLLQGFGSAGLINLAVVLIGDYWDGTDRARLIGYNAAVLTVSVALFPALGGMLASIGTWRWAFAPYALALLTAVAVLVLLPHRARNTEVSIGHQVRSAVAVLRQPVVLGSVTFGFVLFVLVFGLFLTVMPFLLEDMGLEAAGRGLFFAMPATGSTIAALSLGRMRARFGARRLLLGSSVLFTIAFVTIGLAPALVFIGAGAVLYGLGEGSSIPTVQDIVAGSAPEASRGAVVAAWVGAARAGQTAGPLLASPLLELIGPGPTFVVGGGLAGVLALAQLVLRADKMGKGKMGKGKMGKGRMGKGRSPGVAVTSGP